MDFVSDERTDVEEGWGGSCGGWGVGFLEKLG